MINEISVYDLADRLAGQDRFILLDVREDVELRQARLSDPRLAWAPMSRLVYAGVEALPPEMKVDKTLPVIVLCQHGIRSSSAAAWLEDQGWTQVTSLAGGIDAYARLVDPRVGTYGE